MFTTVYTEEESGTQVSNNYFPEVKLEVLVAQLCPILCNPLDSKSPGSSVHGILQARILECVAILFSRGSSDPGIEQGLLHCRQIFFTACEVLIKQQIWTLTPKLQGLSSNHYTCLLGEYYLKTLY